MNPNFIATSTKVLGEQFVKAERKADEERLNNQCPKINGN